MNKNISLIQNLKARDLFYQSNNEKKLTEILSKKKITLYMGIDPTSDDLHVGHFSALMALSHFQKAGHKVLVLVGGATGMVGDPSGKSTQRSFLSNKAIEHNIQGLKNRIEKVGLLKFSGLNPAFIVNNADWLKKFSFLKDFMRGIAPTFSINDMVKFTTFQDRLQKEEPLSLMEFLYPVLQAWDFLHLYENEACTLQVGGQDQWTNMLAGINTISRLSEKKESAFIMTFPLLTTSDGKKMGKTEKGAIWLNPKKTPPYDFYQYFISQPDDVIPTLLKRLTFLSLDQINEITSGDPREAQERTAYEITKLVHGKKEADDVQKTSKALFGNNISKAEIPIHNISNPKLLIDLLIESNCLQSKSQVRRRVKQKGIEIDGKKVSDPYIEINSDCLIKYSKKGYVKVKFK